jgi:predicted GNAT family acetyltransferase
MDVNLDAVSVSDNEAAGRYEAHVDGQLAVITYRRSGDRITFIHTGVPAPLEGRGIAGKMARVALGMPVPRVWP